MISLSSLNGSKNPLNFFSILKYRKEFKRENPTYFDPDGLIVFCGAQRSR